MTLIDKAEAHDDDLIRRGDALAAIQLGDTVTKLQARIRAIPYVDADPVCTGCGGTGVTYQTERRCACQGPDLTDPVTVHANMLRGTIAKPTVEQIIHLYGVDALTKALAPVIVREAALDDLARLGQEYDAAPNLKRIGTGLYEAQPAVNAPAEDAKAKGETDGETLERLGMDGAKWAAEFRTTALRLGYSDMDEGWLIGWFCNAIMAGYDRAPTDAAHVNEPPKSEHDAGNVLTDAAQAREAALYAIKRGFLSAAPGEWRVGDVERVTTAILRALEQEGR
ncbi:hypothetical protein [Microcystis phage Mel-JY03]